MAKRKVSANLNTHFTEIVQEEAATLGMSIEDVANKAGLSKATIYRGFNDPSAMRVVTIEKIAQALAIPVIAFWGVPFDRREA